MQVPRLPHHNELSGLVGLLRFIPLIVIAFQGYFTSHLILNKPLLIVIIHVRLPLSQARPIYTYYLTGMINWQTTSRTTAIVIKWRPPNYCITVTSHGGYGDSNYRQRHHLFSCLNKSITKNNQGSPLLAYCKGHPSLRVDSLSKGPVMRRTFPYRDVVMWTGLIPIIRCRPDTQAKFPDQ